MNKLPRSRAARRHLEWRERNAWTLLNKEIDESLAKFIKDCSKEGAYSAAPDCTLTVTVEKNDGSH